MSSESCPQCPQPVCAPQCKEGAVCTLSVKAFPCDCQIASCNKISFDTGADGDDSHKGTSSKGSVVGPVIGAIAGLGVVALIAFLVIRKRRRQQRMKRVSNMMSGQDDSLESFSKRWHSSSSSELGNKDVIRIAYIPSMIGESPVVAPEPAAQEGGAPQPRFAPMRDEDRSKHDSVASHMSGILDEAVVMAVTTKATPQVIKLNTIKATQSDLIQRSNTLHSSNSIKRSKSQRRLADARNKNKSSPLSENVHVDGDTDSEGTNDLNYHSQDVRAGTLGARRPSAASPSENDPIRNPFMTQAELSAGAGAGTGKSTGSSHLLEQDHDSSPISNTDKSSSSSHRTSNPFLSISETAVPSARNSAYSNTSSSVMSDSTTVFASIPITLGDHYDPSSPLSDLPEPNLRPWTSTGSTALRDSTFSTMSDARSSTRGDGEEIMIFWDGNRDRDSKVSNM